jgi:hypothetical protein
MPTWVGAPFKAMNSSLLARNVNNKEKTYKIGTWPTKRPRTGLRRSCSEESTAPDSFLAGFSTTTRSTPSLSGNSLCFQSWPETRFESTLSVTHNFELHLRLVFCQGQTVKFLGWKVCLIFTLGEMANLQKSQLAKNINWSVWVMICMGWLFGKLTFGGWPFLLV